MQTKETHTRFLAQIEENRRIILKICLFYSNTQEDRQDLFQEIVLQAWKSYPGFRQESKFSTWLYTISLNTALSSKRKQKRLIEGHASEITFPDFNDPPNELYSKMYSAIEELNEIEKSIVLLYLDSYDYEEMEKILGISNGALRVKMSRIKQKLKNLVK